MTTTQSHRPARLLATVALGAALGLSAPAEGQVIRDGSIGPGMDVQPIGPHYEIPATMGEQNGGNLFHSFDDFSLHTAGGVSESATFTPDGAVGPIDNVVSRVTGGSPSEIDGTLRSTIPEADFYFLNPAGLIFGPNGRLDVQGSFHASTADRLEFSNGEVFEAWAGGAVPLLTVASPVEFGFLDANVAPIVVERGGNLGVSGGEALSLVGAGDVTIAGSARADSSSGDAGSVTVRGGSVSVPGSVSAAHGSVLVEATDDVTIAGFVRASSGFVGSSDVAIRGRSVEIDRNGTVSTALSGGEGAAIRVEADAIDVAGAIFTHLRGNARGAGIEINAGTISIPLDGFVGSFAYDAAHGSPITLRADSMQITGASDVSIRSSAFDASTGGDVVLQGRGLNPSAVEGAPLAERITIVGTGIHTHALGSGPGPDLSVAARRVELSNASLATQAEPTATPTGRGGDLVISAGDLFVLDSSKIVTTTFEAGAGGDVRIRVSGEVTVEGVPFRTPRPPVGFQGTNGLEASTGFGTGPGGSMSIQADRLRVTGAGVSVTTNGAGDAGNLTLKVGDLDIAARGFISTTTVGTGDAGIISVTADRSVRVVPLLPFVQGPDFGFLSGILAVSFGAGNAKLIEIDAPVLEVGLGGIIATSALEAEAGDLVLRVGELTVRDGALVDSSTVGAGHAGRLVIEAGAVNVVGEDPGGLPSRIRAFTAGEGNAAALSIEAGSFLLDGGAVATSTLGNKGHGDAGSIVIDAGTLTLLNGGRIDSSSFSNGAAGEIQLRATDLVRIEGGATLSTSTGGSGDAGLVEVTARRIEVEDGSEISSASRDEAEDLANLFRDAVEFNIIAELPRADELPAGDGGSIRLAAEEAIVIDGGVVTSESVGLGEGGAIELAAPVVRLDDGAVVSASTIGVGPGGGIEIVADRITLQEGVRVEALSRESDAGSILLAARDSIQILGGAITTEAENAAGGDVTLLAPNLVELTRSEISASVAAGEGGSVLIDPTLVLLQDSTITAKAVQEGGRGGRIVISADAVLATVGGEAVPPESVLDASAPGGPELSGTVEVNAPDTDLAGQITKLSESYFDVSSMIQPHCAARGGASGSFTTVGHGGIPASPDGFLSASLLASPRGLRRSRASC